GRPGGLMKAPVGLLAMAGLIVAGGLRGASPAACLSPWLCPIPARDAAAASVAPAAQPQDGAAAAGASAPSGGETTYEQLQTAIDRLGAFEYADRMKAAQIVRRTRGTLALPALVESASGHA